MGVVWARTIKIVWVIRHIHRSLRQIRFFRVLRVIFEMQGIATVQRFVRTIKCIVGLVEVIRALRAMRWTQVIISGRLIVVKIISSFCEGQELELHSIRVICTPIACLRILRL